MRQPTILVAEDECIIAMDLCATVEEAGYCVEGPFGDTVSAMAALELERPDLAILDVKLDNGEVFPLAEMLTAQNVPIIFHSGEYSVAEIGRRYPGTSALAKPCPPKHMLETVQRALQSS